MSETAHQDFMSSAAARDIKQLVRSLCDDGPHEGLEQRILVACWQARIYKEDPHAVRRTTDALFNKEMKKPVIANAANRLVRLLREFPEHLSAPVGFALKNAGFRVDGDPVPKLASVLEELFETAESAYGLPREESQGGLMHRQRHVNLLFPENIDTGTYRSLPSIPTCLAFEIEFLFRCWNNGWEESAGELSSAGVPLPACNQNFYRLAVEIAATALDGADDSFIDPRTLEQFVNRNPNVLIVNWPD